ncbi:MAG: hypothetical protein M2R45_01437 [Verrucomicrobia subdivision 3 bacterium]|nr:hypothetical protein [Limisphaerales bacterium]
MFGIIQPMRVGFQTLGKVTPQPMPILGRLVCLSLGHRIEEPQNNDGYRQQKGSENTTASIPFEKTLRHALSRTVQESAALARLE